MLALVAALEFVSMKIDAFTDASPLASSSRVAMKINGTPGPCTWSTEPCLCSPQPPVVAQHESSCTAKEAAHVLLLSSPLVTPISKGMIFVNYISL
jgi:hypothetical protein